MGKICARQRLEEGGRPDRRETGLQRGPSRSFFTKYFAGHGGEIVKEQKYSTGDKDFKPQLTSIKAAKPDAIFIPGYYAEVALIGKQARLLGIKVPLLGGDGWVGDSLLKVAGNSLDGSFFSCHFSAEDKSPAVAGIREEVQGQVQRRDARRYGGPGLRQRRDSRRGDQEGGDHGWRKNSRRPSPPRRITKASPATSLSMRSAMRRSRPSS